MDNIVRSKLNEHQKLPVVFQGKELYFKGKLISDITFHEKKRLNNKQTCSIMTE